MNIPAFQISGASGLYQMLAIGSALMGLAAVIPLVGANPVLLLLIGLVGAVFGQPIQHLLVLFRDVLDVGATEIGLLATVMGAGALFGSTATRVTFTRWRGGSSARGPCSSLLRK